MASDHGQFTDFLILSFLACKVGTVTAVTTEGQWLKLPVVGRIPDCAREAGLPLRSQQQSGRAGGRGGEPHPLFSGRSVPSAELRDQCELENF